MSNRLKLLFHTIKYMRYKQIIYRVYYRLKRISCDELELIQNKLAVSSDLFCWEGVSYSSQSLFHDGTACFLNQRLSISSSGSWNNSEIPKLWLYNLHYMDDLNSTDATDRVDFHNKHIERWIIENPLSRLGNAWEPYTLSLRLVNLIKWYSRNKIQNEQFRASIYQQAQALSQQCEFHILANHLFANAKALVFSGIFLGQDGNGFLNQGVKILSVELEEQFLSDGAHFELSPMYHSVLLWDILELIDLSICSKNKELLELSPKLFEIAVNGCKWLENMCHPDGDISYFNDAAIGIAPELIRVQRYASKLGVKLERDVNNCNTDISSMLDSGYSVVTLGSKNHKLIINHAEIGPSYQPGHAHADTLSFELSLFGCRVLVNSGVSQYGLGKQRDYERSTMAHNTVTVDEENSSEVWSGFRVAKRAAISEFATNISDDEISLVAAHDGFSRLRNSIEHKRSWTVLGNTLLIKDSLSNLDDQLPRSYYHLHPEVEIIEVNSREITLNISALHRLKIKVDAGNFYTEKYEYHPGFGLSQVGDRLVIEWVSSESVVNMNWYSDDS